MSCDKDSAKKAENQFNDYLSKKRGASESELNSSSKEIKNLTVIDNAIFNH